MSELLRLEHITKVFQSRKGFFGSVPIKAVDNVSLTISRGETVALVGESGSGKTTLGRISLRLLEPTAGRIIFDGREITRIAERQLVWFRRRAQAIFQDPYSSIDPLMSVYEIVEEPLLIHSVAGESERDAIVHEVLEAVKLTPIDEFKSKYPHELSGGQRQRVGIARALTLKPDYMVADEPVSMIDASSRAEVLGVLRQLQLDYRITFLYITHDIATARHFSDRIAVMHRGRIVEIGPTETVIENPRHAYTKALIAAVPEPDPSNRFRERQVADYESLA
jgi:peptide/nickel transport system ATP-binding protein